MVDFATIRSHRGSQNNAFEELVVQLARRRPPQGAKSFRRIEGSWWRCRSRGPLAKADGSAVGIQAKYFLRVRDIDWTQINESVATTLKERPEVRIYNIALACDLTDKGGAKGRGKSGWAAWDDHVKHWTDQALHLGRTISFEPVTASDIVDWLGQPNAAGLARYWFNKDILTLPWFSERVRIASADLGERYTPSHHVTVNASLAFDGAARTATLRSRLLKSVEATWKHRAVRESTAVSDEVQEAAGKASLALKAVHRLVDEVNRPAADKWDTDSWLLKIQLAETSLSSLEKVLEYEGDGANSRETSPASKEWINYWKIDLRRCSQALRELSRLLQSTAIHVDRHRVLIVDGEAGTGKSHLLGAEANRAITEGRPALLFLGQQFSQGNPWDQCERSLGLQSWARDELFGALDSAGEANAGRTLVLVDAVNEGAGATLWRSHMAGFIESLRPYSNVAVVIACRTEYVRFAIPESVVSSFPSVKLRGFTTFEEQEAAAVQYLDRRGIVRPAGPLLAPEFSHPLFLKAASDALIRRHTYIFPRGLRGALNILSFYLDSVGGDLLSGSLVPVDCSPELRDSLARLARRMADDKLDYVPKRVADSIVSERFTFRSPPIGISWLEVLLRNGVLRLDPDPTSSGDDAFVPPDDVVRIAFQRFQDHLIVQELLSNVSESSKLFSVGGVCEWLVSGSMQYTWAGLFEALSIKVPEVYGVELVDILPGGETRWWRDWGIQESFAQSVRWRAVIGRSNQSTFTARSLALLNSLDHPEGASIRLLLELAASPGHPWNADLLHSNLNRWKLNQRDLRWSQVLAFASYDEEHPVYRLLNWAIGGNLDFAEPEILRLVGLTMTWLLSSNSRHLRDTATRGLCRLLVKAPEHHHNLLVSFSDVDDLYVLERLLAASYGAACRLGRHSATAIMATSVFQLIFSLGHPPKHLLARDYALGVLEVANHFGILPAAVDLTKARPPFVAKVLRAPSNAWLEKKKELLGDNSVFWSCAEHGDFGRYKIHASVSRFSAATLNEPTPLTARGRFNLFVSEVVEASHHRAQCFEALESRYREVWRRTYNIDESNIEVSSIRLDAAVKEASEAEAAFLALLQDDERGRYERDVSEWLSASSADNEPQSFDVSWAQRWVTARVYSLGWTKKLFGNDTSSYDHGRQRARMERVGKKYQWIALYELLAWLSDTHWVKGGWEGVPRQYAYPTDTDFQRDIDPTLVVDADLDAKVNDDTWRLEFDFDAVEADQLEAWVRKRGPWQVPESVISRVNQVDESWITLYSFQRKVEAFSDQDTERREISLRRECFLFVQAVLVARKSLAASYEALVAAERRDVHSFEPVDLVDGPFLGEYPWRPTWGTLGWNAVEGLPESVQGLKPIVEYQWESHLDMSEPDGVRFRLPDPELLRLLGLQPPSLNSPHVTRDDTGTPVIIHQSDNGGSYSVAIRREKFEKALLDNQLGCLWFICGERSAWPAGNQEGSVRRWFGTYVKSDGTNVQSHSWDCPW